MTGRPRRARRYGYPALIALTPDTAKFATLRSAFEPQPLAEFIESLRQARPSPTPAQCGSQRCQRNLLRA